MITSFQTCISENILTCFKYLSIMLHHSVRFESISFIQLKQFYLLFVTSMEYFSISLGGLFFTKQFNIVF